MVCFQLPRPRRFHLPAPLRSAGVTPFRRYYGCSDSCRTSSLRTGLPASFVVPSAHSVSNHPLPSHCVVWVIRQRAYRRTTPAGVRRVLADQASGASPFPSRLATATGRIEFACATDWTFASGCSPPSFTGTQLPLATRNQTFLDEDLHLADTTTSQAH